MIDVLCLLRVDVVIIISIAMNNLPSRWGLWIVFSLLVLVGTSAVSSGSLIEVNGIVTVLRGSRADLSQVLTFHNPPTQCSVRHVSKSGHSCGEVTPNQFNCKKHQGPILYQHLGCMYDRELVTFQLSVLPQNYTTMEYSNEHTRVQIFSIEIRVVSSGPPLVSLSRIEPPFENQSGHLSEHDFRIVFNQALIDKCHYEIVSGCPSLLLPSFGTLEGLTNQALPCGYTDVSNFKYKPLGDSIHMDFILVKLHHEGESGPMTEYVVLPIQSSEPSISVLPRKELTVRQIVNTPISPSLLSLVDDLSQSLPQHIRHHSVFRYLFPVLPTGAFQSIDGTAVNLTHTEFTSNDIVRGFVSFHPSDIHFELNSNTTVFTYNVTSIAGVMVATGNVSVVAQYDRSRLTQRTNKPLALVEGGMAVIDSRTIDFYFFGTMKCDLYGLMQVMVPPQHGRLKFLRGNALNDSAVLIDAVRNGTLVMYEHSGDESVADCIVWTVGCLSQPLLYVSMTVLVAPVDDIPPHILGNPSITVYRNWAIPLTPSLLHVSDVDSSDDEVMLKVVQNPEQQSKGVVVKLTKELADNMVLSYMPFLDAQHLLKASNVSSELLFSLSEVKDYSIWYIPPTNTSYDSIDVILSDSNNEIYLNDAINVTVNERNLSQNLFLSTDSSYPWLLQSKPLPLHTHLGIYITSSYLYAVAREHSSEHILYLIGTPPTNGFVCHVSQIPCDFSVSQFTQHDVNMQEVIYFPKSIGLLNDSFEFEVTLNGFRNYESSLNIFNVSAIRQQTSISSDMKFWVSHGHEKAVAPRFFRPFRKVLSRRLDFTITTPPHYGNLILRQSDSIESNHPRSFTFDDLLRRRLRYNHHRSAFPACSDQFIFSASNGTHTLSNLTLMILVRRGSSKLQISFKPRTLQGQTRFVFSGKDFNVTSSFCPDFVHFTLAVPPSMGTLTLVDANYNTLLQLEANSTFTARDVYSGLLRYRALIADSGNSTNFDEFDLIASDPIGEWPSKLIPRLGPGTYNESVENIGHFMVYFIPSPDVTRVLKIQIASPRPLTWLSAYNKYGHIISENEITVNSSLQPRQVVFQVEIAPAFGSVMKNLTPAYIFDMQDVLDGIVWYHSTVRYDHISSVSFQLGIYANLTNYSKSGAKYDYVIEWATVEMRHNTITVAEESGVANIVLRRTGATWFESHVLLTTHAQSATSVSNCTAPARSGDFCNVSCVVVFPIGVVSVTVSVPLLDDNEAENKEMFIVSISEPYDAVFRYGTTHDQTTVYITDEADYAFISIAPTSEGGNIQTCASQRLTRVFENVGTLSLKLIRQGNLHQRVGVFCYTEDDVAVGGDDYIPRDSNAISSIVWFEAFQTTAYCNISIVNDTDYEFSELFFVQLAIGDTPSLGHAIVNRSTFPACVFINSDRNDEPVVYFKDSEVVIQESTTEEVHAEFTLLRNGTDLTKTTVVRYSWLPKNGDKAMVNEDFSLFPNDNERCGGVNDRDGCVEFSSGQTMATLAVKILHDNELEGNESFHLSVTVYNGGRVETLSSLKVTILDGEEPATVEFTQPVYVFNETMGFLGIPIVRSGYTRGPTTVECIQKGINATASLNYDGDFAVTPDPESVTFSENVTRSMCNILIIDDDIFEGREELRIQLGTNQDFGVNLPENTSQVIVFIEDPEDSESLLGVCT